MDFLSELLSSSISAKKMEEKGQTLYKASKILMFIGLCGLAILLIIAVIAFMISPYAVLNVLTLSIDALAGLIFIIYLDIALGLLGIPLYFASMNIYALGRIAQNTEKSFYALGRIASNTEKN